MRKRNELRRIYTIASDAFDVNTTRRQAIDALKKIRDIITDCDDPDDDDDDEEEEAHRPLLRANPPPRRPNHERPNHDALSSLALQITEAFLATGGARRHNVMKCANCSIKMPFTGDTERDHHTMQRHHVEQCPHRHDAYAEQQKLLAEFEMERRPLISAGERN